MRLSLASKTQDHMLLSVKLEYSNRLSGGVTVHMFGS